MIVCNIMLKNCNFLNSDHCNPLCSNPNDRVWIKLSCSVSAPASNCSKYNAWLVNNSAVDISSPLYTTSNDCGTSDGQLVTSLLFAINESTYGCYLCKDSSTLQASLFDATHGQTCQEALCIGVGCNQPVLHERIKLGSSAPTSTPSFTSSPTQTELQEIELIVFYFYAPATLLVLTMILIVVVVSVTVFTTIKSSSRKYEKMEEEEEKDKEKEEKK